jgi:hypothetical protein
LKLAAKKKLKRLRLLMTKEQLDAEEINEIAAPLIDAVNAKYDSILERRMKQIMDFRLRDLHQLEEAVRIAIAAKNVRVAGENGSTEDSDDDLLKLIGTAHTSAQDVEATSLSEDESDLSGPEALPTDIAVASPEPTFALLKFGKEHDKGVFGGFDASDNLSELSALFDDGDELEIAQAVKDKRAKALTDAVKKSRRTFVVKVEDEYSDGGLLGTTERN